jgi:hypothetical protein
MGEGLVPAIFLILPGMEIQNTGAVASSETKDILNNEQFGETKTARRRNLARAQAVSSTGGTVSVVAAAWAWIHPVPYEPLMFLLLLLPPAAVFFAIRFNGLLRFGPINMGTSDPTVIVFTLAPVFGIMVRVQTDFRLYSYQAIWAICIVGGLLLTLGWYVLCSKALARESNKALVVCIGAIVAGCYVFGLVLFVNCFYDNSRAKEFWVTVTGKHINHSKSKRYYLELEPWGQLNSGENESVGKTMYNEVKVGQQMHIYLHQGKWHIPWYIVTE